MNSKPIFPDSNKEIISKYDSTNDANIVKNIIKGKLDVGLIHLTQKLIIKYELEKYSIHFIPLRMTSQNSMMSIIYCNNENAKLKAHELYTTIKRQMKDSDISEQKIETFAQQIEKDNEDRELDKVVLYEEDDFKVCAVNGDFIRGKDPGLNFDQFVDGGSHYVTSYPGYKKHIPEDEIWIDDVFRSKPHDLCAIILHEKIERYMMKNYGMSYDDAHTDYANPAEEEYRKRGKGGFDINLQKEIFDKFVEKYQNKHKKKKLNESYQFNKTKNLFRKII
jgi:hypothetical protein